MFVIFLLVSWKFVIYQRKNVKFNFIQYLSQDDRFRGETLQKVAEKFRREILFLTVSLRNRQFIVCPFLPEARNFGVFFTLTVHV